MDPRALRDIGDGFEGRRVDEAPVGLCGRVSTTSRVRAVIAAAMASGSIA